MKEAVRKKGREASAKAKQARADAFAAEMEKRLSRYAGQSLNAIARSLNAKHVPTASGKGSWTAKAVSNVRARIAARKEPAEVEKRKPRSTRRSPEPPKRRDEAEPLQNLEPQAPAPGSIDQLVRAAEWIEEARAMIAAMAEANAAARARLMQVKAGAAEVKKAGEADS
jgi:hypothetical protein